MRSEAIISVICRCRTSNASSSWSARLTYSALVVGILTDYVIRPRLVGGGSHVPSVLTFMSLFGGVEVFGITGLVVGPVIVTLCMAVLKTYEGEVVSAPPE